MVLFSTSVHVVEQAAQMAGASVYVPSLSSSCLLSLQETLQNQQVSLNQTSIKLLLLPLVPECVRYCVSPLRVKFLFPPALLVS